MNNEGNVNVILFLLESSQLGFIQTASSNFYSRMVGSSSIILTVEFLEAFLEDFGERFDLFLLEADGLHDDFMLS